jgi:hypothetical protein
MATGFDLLARQFCDGGGRRTAKTPRTPRLVGSFCRGRDGWCAVVRPGASARNEFCKLGHSGTFGTLRGGDMTEGTEARRHAGTEWGPGFEGASADGERRSGEATKGRSGHLIPCCRRRPFVASWLDAFVPLVHSLPLRKTGGVMRFGEHFCAADFYKRGFCRGICVEIVLDFCFGAVGFLVMGAQRARGRGRSET